METPTPIPALPVTVTTPLGVVLTVEQAEWTDRVDGFPARPGKLYLVLDVALYNPTNQTLDYALALYAQVLTKQGYEIPVAPLPLERGIGLTTLYPNATRRGVVAFALYPDEGPFTLVIQDDPLDPWKEPVRIALPSSPAPTATPTPQTEGRQPGAGESGHMCPS